MKAIDLMTSDPFTVTPADSIARAAEVMRNVGVGAVPVVTADNAPYLRGIITDRDIAVRCVASHHDANCRVADHMTPMPLRTVFADTHQSQVLAEMENAQVRRILVVDTHGRLVGIIAQADIARKLGPDHPRTVDELLELVSAPACPTRT